MANRSASLILLKVLVGFCSAAAGAVAGAVCCLLAGSDLEPKSMLVIELGSPWNQRCFD